VSLGTESENKMTLSEYLQETPLELSLATGCFGVYAHIGFLKALAEKGISTSVNLYGSSAGALVGSMLAYGISVNEVEQIVSRIKLAQYWDPKMGLGLLKGERLHQLLAQYLPAQFSDLKLPFHLSVFDIKIMRSKIISTGDLISAVRASSAFPGLFQPVKIGSSLCLDGGIGDEYGIGERKSEKLLLVHGFAPRPYFKKSYEKLKLQKSKVLHLHAENLPKANPFNMQVGSEIVKQSYLQIKKLLEMPIEHFVIK
jgi:NTE family protein